MGFERNDFAFYNTPHNFFAVNILSFVTGDSSEPF